VLDAFLAARQDAGTATEHDEEVISYLRHCLDSYGHTRLAPEELALVEDVVEDVEDDAEPPAFTDVFGPDKIPHGVADLLGWYLLRKVFSPSPGVLGTAGAVCADLLAWLTEQGLVDEAVIDGAASAAGEAGDSLPRAERLATLLFEATETLTRDDLAGADPDAFVDDYLPISRVEPGQLWFDGLGPVEVPQEASQLAEVGWEANVVLASTPSGWRLVETGNVYPKDMSP
jgi:hypothetical protein